VTDRPPELLGILREVYERPLSLKSNYARQHAVLVALAASTGLITSVLPCGSYNNAWRLTVLGTRVIFGETDNE
jgi:hypothetical protein